MPVFGRRRKGSRESDDALDTLSSSARSVVVGSGRTRRMWRSLVEKVGVQSAIEHVEVSALMGMIDAAAEVTSIAMREWRGGLATNAIALQGLIAVHDGTKQQVEVTIQHVQQASSRPEALAIAAAGPGYLDSMFKVAMLFIAESMTDAEGYTAISVKQAWTDACDKWDAATGRARLPLVGD